MPTGRYIPWPTDNPGPWTGVWLESVGCRDCTAYNSLLDPDFLCIHLVEKGQARFQTAMGVDVVVGPDDLCCIWPHIAWRLFSEPPFEGEQVVMDWVRIKGDLAFEYMRCMGLSEDRPWGRASQPEKARSLMRRLATLALEYPDKADLTAVNLLYQLAEACAHTPPAPTIERSPAQRIKEAMRQQVNSGMNVNDFAKAFRISRSNLLLLFRKTFNKSPMDVLTDIRIQHAQELLRDTNLSIGEVATASGYTDPLYFSRQFRKQTGQAPRHFRNTTQRQQLRLKARGYSRTGPFHKAPGKN